MTIAQTAAAVLPDMLIRAARDVLRCTTIEHVVITTDGEVRVKHGPGSVDDAVKVIGADVDVITLRDPDTHHPTGLVMIVDDMGHPKGLPINPIGTALYLMGCRVGADHAITGTAYVMHDR